MKLYQCLLTRGTQETVAWIPKRAARIGVYVELLPSKEMWAVIDVYANTPQDEDTLKEKQRQNRKGLPSLEKGWRDK